MKLKSTFAGEIAVHELLRGSIQSFIFLVPSKTGTAPPHRYSEWGEHILGSHGDGQ